jgi:hypothetical protein
MSSLPFPPLPLIVHRLGSGVSKYAGLKAGISQEISHD